MIIYIQPVITLETLCQEMREICKFDHEQNFTMKWVDEEGKSIFSLNLIALVNKQTFKR